MKLTRADGRFISRVDFQSNLCLRSGGLSPAGAPSRATAAQGAPSPVSWVIKIAYNDTSCAGTASAVQLYAVLPTSTHFLFSRVNYFSVVKLAFWLRWGGNFGLGYDRFGFLMRSEVFCFDICLELFCCLARHQSAYISDRQTACWDARKRWMCKTANHLRLTRSWSYL